MSEENAEVIERAWRAGSRLDAEAFVAFCDPDVEFRGAAEGSTYHGHDGVRDFFSRLSEVFEPVPNPLLALEVIDGGDRAVVCIRFRFRGRGSEIDVEQQSFQALRLRDGKALWWEFYESKAEALEAVGLRE